MKDEKYRELTWADIHDETPKLEGKNKVRVWCPECGEKHSHRSLVIDKNKGCFHCFYCGLHGPYKKEGPNDPTNNTPTNGRPTPDLSLLEGRGHYCGSVGGEISTPLQKGGVGGGSSVGGSASGGGSSSISDFIPLSPLVLEAIADLSLAPDEKNPHQLEVRRYLEEQKLPLELAQKMRWGVACVHVKLKEEEKGQMRTCLVYRNYVEGICCNAKYRTVKRECRTVERIDGTKLTVWETMKGFTQESAVTPAAPYNIDAISPRVLAEEQQQEEHFDHHSLYITEGEKDCLVLRLLGFRYVISVSNGAQTDMAKMFEPFVSWLRPFRRVVICGDQDRAGRSMVEHVAAYFDDREVAVAQWDRRHFGKDITEVYQQQGEQTARDLVLNAYPRTSDDVLCFDTDDELAEISRLSIEEERPDRYSLGIGPLTDQHFMLTTEGGLIIVTGTPNTGKTDFLNFLTTRLMALRGSSVCFCSFETPNKRRHLARLAQLWIGATPAKALTPEQLCGYVQAVARRTFHLELRRQRPTTRNILNKAEAVLRQHPTMEYLVIDPYLYMDVGKGRNITETEAIKEMLTEVQDWAQEHRIWVFIVAHPRKLNKDDGTEEFEKIDMYTIAGSANWANIADFIISLERVRKSATHTDYTRLSVLKVRDQELCSPGEVIYVRQGCGRYDERDGVKDLGPYRLTASVNN